MSSKLFTIHPDQTVEEAMELMTNQRVRHLPVVADDKVLGVISIGDVVKNIIFHQRETIKNLCVQIKHKPHSSMGPFKISSSGCSPCCAPPFLL